MEEDACDREPQEFEGVTGLFATPTSSPSRNNNNSPKDRRNNKRRNEDLPPLIDPADFTPIAHTIGAPAKKQAVTPNGSATNETILNLVYQAIEYCISLKRVSHTNSVERIRGYVINNVQLTPTGVKVDPPTSRAYIFFGRRWEYNQALAHRWEFGVLDHPEGYDPTEPQGIRFQILYTTDSLDFPDMQVRVAETFAKANQVAILAVVPTANPEICAIRFKNKTDMSNVCTLGRQGGTVVVPPKGADKKAHSFMPIIALAFTDHPEYEKYHMANLPPNTDEAKLHLGLIHYLEANGFSRSDLISAGVQHKKDTGAPTTYGFAYIRRGAPAAFLMESPIVLRNTTITFSKVSNFAPAQK